MPLFGSNKHEHGHGSHGVTDNTTSGGRQHGVQPINQSSLNDNSTQQPGAGNANMFGQTPVSGPGANYDNNPQQTGPGQTGQSTAGQFGRNDPYTASGVGSGRQAGGQGFGGQGIPPAGAIDRSHGSTGSHGSGGGRLTGKIESAIGSLVGSDALKAKGLQKENEANAIKAQGGELAEAERLEREALMRRERAVAHGADPANSALGAGNPGIGSGHGGPGAF